MCIKYDILGSVRVIRGNMVGCKVVDVSMGPSTGKLDVFCQQETLITHMITRAYAIAMAKSFILFQEC